MLSFLLLSIVYILYKSNLGKSFALIALEVLTGELNNFHTFVQAAQFL